MICRWVRLPNGMTAHVRMATPRRRRCSACNQLTAHEKLRECDWKIGANETCDALVCVGCAYVPAKDKDLCQKHARVWKDRQQASAAQARAP